MVSVNLVIVAVVVVAQAAAVAEGQSTSSCVQKLTPCALYLNGTSTPPDTCCSPLKEAVANEKDCLCAVYKSPGLLPSLGVNSTQVAALAKSCGVNADASTICSGTHTHAGSLLFHLVLPTKGSIKSYHLSSSHANNFLNRRIGRFSVQLIYKMIVMVTLSFMGAYLFIATNCQRMYLCSSKRSRSLSRGTTSR